MKKIETGKVVFGGEAIRFINFEGEPWLAASDILKSLGLETKRITDSIKKVDPEDCVKLHIPSVSGDSPVGGCAYLIRINIVPLFVDQTCPRSCPGITKYRFKKWFCSDGGAIVREYYRSLEPAVSFSPPHEQEIPTIRKRTIRVGGEGYVARALVQAGKEIDVLKREISVLKRQNTRLARVKLENDILQKKLKRLEKAADCYSKLVVWARQMPKVCPI